MVMEKRPKRVHKSTRLKPGQRLVVTVPRKGKVYMKVPEGTEVAVEQHNSNNNR
jgi:hypothetical protein